MIRIMDVEPNGTPRIVENADHVAPPQGETLRWIDIELRDSTELDLLARHFGFHPLTIEDCANFDQRPKHEDYDNYVFIVTHGFEMQEEPAEELRTLELHSFLAPGFLVTVHDAHLPPIDFVWDRIKGDGAIARRGTDFIRYLIADAMVELLFPLVDRLATRVEDIEDRLLRGQNSHNPLEEILNVKRQFVEFRKLLSPQRNVMAHLCRPEGKFVSEKTAFYFRDVHDHLLRISEAVEVNRELLESVLAGYQWTISQHTSNVVKRLTILSAIFLPLTFITGFFGQNFEGIPFESQPLLLLMLITCALLPAVMLWLFFQSKWFR